MAEKFLDKVKNMMGLETDQKYDEDYDYEDAEDFDDYNNYNNQSHISSPLWQSSK